MCQFYICSTPIWNGSMVAFGYLKTVKEEESNLILQRKRYNNLLT